MKLRILFDYGADFLWLSDDGMYTDVHINSDGYFESNYYFPTQSHEVWKYPEERLKGQYELERKVNYINETYPKLFIDNEVEFSYRGFDSEEDERIFDDAVRFVYKKLVELLGDDYEITNKTTIDMLIE